MASLEEVWKKIEEQRLAKLEQEKIEEQKVLENYEKQRQFWMNERKLYEASASAAAGAGAGGGGGGNATRRNVAVVPTGFNVRFNVTDNYSSIMVNAGVFLGDNSGTTDTDGNCVFTNIPETLAMEWTITKLGWSPLGGVVDVIAGNVDGITGYIELPEMLTKIEK
jgi:hypothetical protein